MRDVFGFDNRLSTRRRRARCGISESSSRDVSTRGLCNAAACCVRVYVVPRDCNVANNSECGNCRANAAGDVCWSSEIAITERFSFFVTDTCLENVSRSLYKHSPSTTEFTFQMPLYFEKKTYIHMALQYARVSLVKRAHVQPSRGYIVNVSQLCGWFL